MCMYTGKPQVMYPNHLVNKLKDIPKGRVNCETSVLGTYRTQHSEVNIFR